MVILHLFIDYHYKSIVSIIRERHVLTLHLSTANCRRKLTTGCCCKNVAACCMLHTLCNFYHIESIPQFLKFWPISMHSDGTLILLYFIEMLPCTVSRLTIITCIIVQLCKNDCLLNPPPNLKLESQLLPLFLK